MPGSLEKEVQGESTIIIGDIQGFYHGSNKHKVEMMSERVFINNASMVALT